MNTKDRILELRKKMAEMGIDAYIVPSSDPHMSEYTASHWHGRQWLSGFTGSAGTLVVMQKTAGLWTDGRYYLQAEEQLAGSDIDLFRAGMEGVPSFTKYLADNLEIGSRIGIDGRLFSVSQVREMEKAFAGKNITIDLDHDLLVGIWNDRPPLPAEPVFIHDIVYAGKTATEKIGEVREKMAEKNIDYHLISGLDDIAWLFNIRGNDVEYNPVAISYALISDKEARLFIDSTKISEDAGQALTEAGIILEDYESIGSHLSGLGADDTVLLDPYRVNSLLHGLIGDDVKKLEDVNITTTLKAVKNRIEIENLRQAHIRDGVAMVKFLYWLDKNVGKTHITEITAADKLEEFRSKQENYMGLSFPTIAGFKDHGAIVHYLATEESAYELDAEGMILIDSGCQYLDGTTDITRAVVLGPVSQQQAIDYTLVLKGNINLAKARFLKGSTGANLDILARMYLWEEGIDYKHGTGHGVGYLLNVHEGPQGISMASSKVKLEDGMIVTNEPGAYREGQYGIRIENELLVREDIKTEFGEFLRFEVLTWCPIDLDAVVVDLLGDDEREWLNSYHQKVYAKLSPFLDRYESQWLKEKTMAI